MASTISFDILARDRASKTFDNVGRSSDGLGRKLGGMGKAVALGAGVAAVGGIALLGKAMVDGVKDAASYQDLQNKTAAVLKSTGNVAHTSVRAIQEHAGALESLSGVDEELIINSQNVLATFTSVRNGVGKGNQIFDQATAAALDMSTALGTDLQGSTIQLGKALNNPVKGITALSRVGVSFTDQQKKQIKTMVAAGDTMGAQKLILGELSKEFGGAAKAAGQGFNGSIARLKDTLGDTFRAIGMKMLPMLTRLADWLGKALPKAIDKMHQIGLRLSTWWRNDLSPALSKAGREILPSLKMAMDMVTGATGKGHVSWKQIGDVLTQKVIPAIAMIAKVALPVLGAIIHNAILQWKLFGMAIKAIWSIAKPVFTFVTQAFLAVVGAIVNGAARAFGWVPGLGPKLQHAAAEFNKFRDGVNRALNGTRNRYSLTVITPGMRETINNLATLRWQIQHIPRSVTIGVSNKLAGIPGFATGVQNFRGGLAMVGEQGPELVSLPRGSNVYPNGTGPGGGGVVININGALDPVAVGKQVQAALLRVKRMNGGRELGIA